MKSYFDEIAEAHDNLEYPDTHIVDGIAVCNKCNTPKQCRMKFLGQERLLGIMCKCEEEAYKKEKAEVNSAVSEAERNQNRSNGLRTGQYGWKFECARRTEENGQFLKLCEVYADKFEEMFKNNIGLKLWGGTGSGKTFGACCIANRLFDNGYRVFCATSGYIVNEIQKANDKNQMISDICSYDLLIIDDFGEERNTETAQQYMEDVIDSRIVRNKPLIITTNIKDLPCDTMQSKRMYSRLESMLQSVKCVGVDNRLVQHNEKKEIFLNLIRGN